MSEEFSPAFQRREQLTSLSASRSDAGPGAYFGRRYATEAKLAFNPALKRRAKLYRRYASKGFNERLLKP